MTRSKEISDEDIAKNEIAYNLFVDTADQNYAVARWSYQRGLYLDFLWNGAHALEKYMKAVLLLNGKSAVRPPNEREGYAHDLVKLFAEVEPLSRGLIPATLTKPDQADLQFWTDESFADFMTRLSELGDPNNRYQVFGYSLRYEDLYRFDRAVFSIRRLCCPLDKYFFGCLDGDVPSITYREVLELDPNEMPRRFSFPLDMLLARGDGEDLRTALYNFNFPFAPAGYQHKHIILSVAAVNPVLQRRILDAVEIGTNAPGAAEALAVADWTMANIRLPNDVIRQLEDAQRRLRRMITSQCFLPFIGPP